MGFDISSLEEDFENFVKNCGTNCSTEAEEALLQELEDDDGFIGTIQKNLLVPNRCGVYLSRMDIKVIGLAFNENVQIRERKRMIRDILRAVTSKEKLIEVFDIIKDAIDQKLEIYNNLVKNFPASKEIFEDKKAKANNFKKLLDKIVEDIDEEVDFVWYLCISRGAYKIASIVPIKILKVYLRV